MHVVWRVLPYRPLAQLSERVWRLEGDLEGMPMKRVMTIARRADGELVVHNAIHRPAMGQQPTGRSYKYVRQ
jgi:hypothetical protein